MAHNLDATQTNSGALFITSAVGCSSTTRHSCKLKRSVYAERFSFRCLGGTNGKACTERFAMSQGKRQRKFTPYVGKQYFHAAKKDLVITVDAVSLADRYVQSGGARYAIKYLFDQTDIRRKDRVITSICDKCCGFYQTKNPLRRVCPACVKIGAEYHEMKQEYLADLMRQAKRPLAPQQTNPAALTLELENLTESVRELFTKMAGVIVPIKEKIRVEMAAAAGGEVFIPQSEYETIWMFAQVADYFGYYPVRLKQNLYPDGVFRTPDGNLLFVEFEYKSSNFILHGHAPEKTDIVVCWIRDVELEVPVLELSQHYSPETGQWDFTSWSVADL